VSKRKILLTLLMHRRTGEKYQEAHEQHIAGQKAWLEEIQGESFESLPEERQIHYLTSWSWPPWRFNDIVGFAEVELENSTSIIAHLYMPDRTTRVTKKPFLLNYACASAHFDENSLKSLRSAIFDIIAQLELLIKDRKWVLEVNSELINHVNFLAMIEEFENADR
jgi:hypothetical protein